MVCFHSHPNAPTTLAQLPVLWPVAVSLTLPHCIWSSSINQGSRDTSPHAVSATLSGYLGSCPNVGGLWPCPQTSKMHLTIPLWAWEAKPSPQNKTLVTYPNVHRNPNYAPVWVTLNQTHNERTIHLFSSWMTSFTTGSFVVAILRGTIRTKLEIRGRGLQWHATDSFYLKASLLCHKPREL